MIYKLNKLSEFSCPKLFLMLFSKSSKNRKAALKEIIGRFFPGVEALEINPVDQASAEHKLRQICSEPEWLLRARMNACDSAITMVQANAQAAMEQVTFRPEQDIREWTNHIFALARGSEAIEKILKEKQRARAA